MQRQNVIDCLFIENCSCVIRNGDTVRIFHERGIKDLFRLLKTEREFLDGAFVADKVVGKGAAALMVLGGVDRPDGQNGADGQAGHGVPFDGLYIQFHRLLLPL